MTAAPTINVKAAEAVSPRTATMRVANLQAMRAADTNVAVRKTGCGAGRYLTSSAPQYGGCHSTAAAVGSRHRTNRSFAFAAALAAAGNFR